MLAAIVACVVAAILQEPQAAPPRSEVLIVGTFHFNADNDMVKSAKHDVLGAKFQAEVRETADRLARFKPNKIVVEYPAADQQKLDKLYQQYLDGKRRDSKNEIDQLGARLASELKLERLYGFDQPSDMKFQPLMESAQKSGRADLLGEFQAKTVEITQKNAEIAAKYSVSEHLAILNHPPIIDEMHRLYIWLLNFDTPDNRPAAALLADWYLRNVNMFENLQRIAEPGDRVLVLVGAGHTKHLRDLVTQDTSMHLNEAAAYLPPTPVPSMAGPVVEKPNDSAPARGNP
ncbi:MAG: DUF5694 domain-containing protein [Phycisphaerales bacterium]